jgi:hypothetical protein
LKAFNKIYSGLSINSLQKEIRENDHLFGEFNARKNAGPVHEEMTDIWVRYGDINGMIESGDYSKIASEHDSIWLQDLPECKKICFQVMSLVDGERLGGVLITKLPIGGRIKPHKDSGWHADYYDKYYVPIENEKGSVFGFDDGVIDPEIGDVWAFDNSYNHWVENNTNKERVALIICIKQSKYNRSGNLINREG